MKAVLVFVFHDNNPKSGATRSLLDIVLQLADFGKYRILTIFPGNAGIMREELEKRGVEVLVFRYYQLIQILDQPKIKRAIKRPLLALRRIGVELEACRAAKLLEGWGVRIVYSNTSTQIFGALLAKHLGAKSIWHIREFGVPDHGIAFYRGEEYMQRFIEEHSDYVLCVSRNVLEYHSRIINPQKMTVSYNSYPATAIIPKSEFNGDKPLNILIAGSICPGKGQMVAVEAIRRLNERHPGAARLCIAGGIGDRRYYRQIERHIDKYKLGNCIDFCGYVDSTQKLRMASDIGVIASRREAFGRTAIEGMLSMMVIVGSDSGGTSEQISHGVTGLLYDGTSEDLALQLELLYCDRVLLRKLAMAGYCDAMQKYTKGQCVQIVDGVIEKALLNNAAS